MSEEKTNLIMTEKPYIKEHFPLLAEIDSPADLKKLTVEQLPLVCDELRRFMVHELSTNPGHFASSMGAVEIVLLSEELNKRRITVKCPSGHTYQETVDSADEKVKCRECGATAVVETDNDLIDDFFEIADSFKTYQRAKLDVLVFSVLLKADVRG